LIRDLLVRAIIGIHPGEREIPQEIVINLELETDLSRAGQTDDIADCLDYQKVVEKVTAHTAEVRRHTVEALASDLLRLCFLEPRVTWVRVQVEKPAAIASCRSVGVELESHRPSNG
jgi:FolB domain-containing protein